DVLTDVHRPPPATPRGNLPRAGKRPELLVVTGSAGVDAVPANRKRAKLPAGLPEGGLVTVTMHRRENLGVMGEVAASLAAVARAYPQYTFVYPVHLNPRVQEAVRPVLGSVGNFRL